MCVLTHYREEEHAKYTFESIETEDNYVVKNVLTALSLLPSPDVPVVISIGHCKIIFCHCCLVAACIIFMFITYLVQIKAFLYDQYDRK